MSAAAGDDFLRFLEDRAGFAVADWQRRMVESSRATAWQQSRRAGKRTVAVAMGAAWELECKAWDVLGDGEEVKTIRREARELAARLHPSL